MSSAAFTLSAFGDEIADDLYEQLRVLKELRINYLELRGAWGKNVLRLDDEEVAAIRRACGDQQIAVSCIGSPVGKSPITAPVEHELANLGRLFEIGEALDTRRVRIFSFYPPETQPPDTYIEEAVDRLGRLADLAGQEGFLLLLENEKGVVGDTPERCAKILEGVGSPHLRFVWDPANFVQVGVERPTDRGWPTLSEYLVYVQVKDALLSDGSVRATGEGDAQVSELLVRLRDSDYRGFLALEPHLAHAGHSGGFSGAAGMTYAAEALRRALAEQGCVEEPFAAGTVEVG